MSHGVSRRSFFGGVAAAIGYLGIGTEIDLFAQNRAQGAMPAAGARPRQHRTTTTRSRTSRATRTAGDRLSR